MDAAILDALRRLALTKEAREALVSAATTWVNKRLKESQAGSDNQAKIAIIDERLD